MHRRISVTLTLTLMLSLASGVEAQRDTTSLPGSQRAGVPLEYAFLFAGGIPAANIAAVRQRIPYDSIVLNRQSCGWTGPGYSVSLHRSGEATMTVVGRVRIPKDLSPGTYTGTVDLFDYGRTAYLLDTLGFMRMDRDYSSTWTDGCSLLLTASRSGVTQSVHEYGGVGPVQLWAIAALLDGIAQHIVWK